MITELADTAPNAKYKRRRLVLLGFVLAGYLVSVAILVSTDKAATTPASEDSAFAITPEMRAEAIAEMAARKQRAQETAASPLHWAVESGDHEAVLAALSNPDSLKVRDASGNTALHLTVRNQQLGYTAALVLIGANPVAQNSAGKTPGVLLESSRTADRLAIENYHRLLAHPFANVPPRLRLVQATFVIAVEHDDKSLLAQTIFQGAMVDEPWTPDGRTALFFVARADTVGQLVQAGANVNVQDENGTTPLMIAVQSGNQRVAKAMIRAGADVNVRDRHARSALTLAIADSRSSLSPCVSLLLGSGSEVGLVEWRAAVTARNARALRRLFSAGASFSADTSEGQAILRWAQMHGGPKVAKTLQDHPTIGPQIELIARAQERENTQDQQRLANLIAPHLAVFVAFVTLAPLGLMLLLKNFLTNRFALWSNTLLWSSLATYLAFFPLDVQQGVSELRWSGEPIVGLLLVAEGVALSISLFTALLVLVLVALLSSRVPHPQNRKPVAALVAAGSIFLLLGLHHVERIHILDHAYFAIVGSPAEALGDSGRY